MRSAGIGVRWTIGDVNERGFEALRLSLWGARRVFGERAALAVCVNTIPVRVAQERTGHVPPGVAWLGVERGDIPRLIRDTMDPRLAEGMGWKFAPLRLFPDRFELSLDNDCILWDRPDAVASWLENGDSGRCLFAAGTRPALGPFAAQCGPEPRNGGIRGLPPGLDYSASLAEVLSRQRRIAGGPVAMTSELDEQGLQAAAVSLAMPALIVTLEEVTICSPFYPHSPGLGRCGAHFLGLNTARIPWEYYGRPADAWMAEHWARHRPTLQQRVGLAGAGAREAGRNGNSSPRPRA